MFGQKNFREESSQNQNSYDSSLFSSSSTSQVKDFFSGLRSLARRVETEVVSMEQQVENLHLNPSSIDADGTQVKHFMQLSCREMKNLKSDVKIIHEDLKRRSSTVLSASELLTSLLESYSDRLESVETFMEKYGYVRPDLQPVEENSLCDASIAKENQECPISSETVVVRSEVENGCVSDVACTHPPHTNEAKELNGLRTPRLEDFGLSEYTLSLYLYRSTKNHQKEKSNTFTEKVCPNLESVSKTLFDTEQPCILSASSTDNSDNVHTPVCSRLKGISDSPSRSEMRTPIPEDFGLSDHVLLRERQKMNFEKTLFLGNIENKPVMDIDSQPFKSSESTLYKDPFVTLAEKGFSPNREENDTGLFHNEQTSLILVMENDNKENTVDGQSPKTPEMPSLSSNLWEASDHFTTKNLIEPNIPSSTSATWLSTPECPKLQTCDAALPADFLAKDVSLLPIVDQTPPLPVLFK